MRRVAVIFLPALAAAAGCALVGYDFDGYGPETPSTSSGASASGGGAAGPGASSGSGPGASSGTGGSTCTATSFQPRVDVKVSEPPFALRAADMDGDLKPDVVMTSPATNRLAVIFNDGKGGLTGEQGQYLSSGQPTAVAVGHFNMDNRLDVVITNVPAQGINAFLNPGNGVFTSSTSITATVGPSGVAVGDFDGNGGNEIAVACSIDGVVLTVPVDGNGGFGSALFIATVAEATAVAVADFNNDKRTDMVVTSPLKDLVTVLSFNGTSYAATTLALVGPQRVAIADFDGDKRLDLAVTSTSLTGTLLLGNDDGTFKPEPVILNFGVATYGIAAADFNRDGFQDLAVTSDKLVFVLSGKGDGSFSETMELAGVVGGRDIEAVDLDNDGWVDLVEGSGSQSSLGVFYNACKPPP
jgi:hypothetical protein